MEKNSSNMHHDVPNNIIQSCNEYDDMPDLVLQSRNDDILPSLPPHSLYVSTTIPSPPPLTVRYGRHMIMLAIPLLFYLIFKQYEVSGFSKQRRLHWSIITKNRRKKECILWSDINKRFSDI